MNEIIASLITDRTQEDVDYLMHLYEIGADNWTLGAIAGETIVGTVLVGDGEYPWFLRAISRGAYNYTDLNRVTRAMEYIDSELKKRGYISGYAPLYIPHRAAVFADDGESIIRWDEWTDTEWNEHDIPTESICAEYLRNIRALRDRFPIDAETPNVPEDMDELHFTEANDIEQILVDVNDVVSRIDHSYIYAGEAFAGEF